jgi:tetratricopeptide (TPR) repeat protein
MPTDAFEDTVELPIELLEAVAPASPYPTLRQTGRKEARTFRAVILENAYLRVTILPGLGGRILSIFDKRTSSEILHAGSLHLSPGGRRGVAMHAAGVSLQLDGSDRPNDLGPVDYQIEEPPEAVWIAETSGGTGLSFHLRIELPPERAELILDVRVLNRTRRPLPYNAGLALQMGFVDALGEVAYSPDRRAGLWIRSDELSHGEFRNGSRLVRSRFSDVGVIGPRQVDSWRAVIVPFSGLDGRPSVSADATAYLAEEKVQVQVAEPMLGARLLLGLADGQTLEAPADLYPEQVLEVPLEGLSAAPVALVVQDGDRQDRLRMERSDRPVREEYAPFLVGLSVPSALGDPEVADMDESHLRNLTFSPAHRALAYLELGHRALARGEYAEADELLETALLYNGDDPLNWWAKAMARRLAGAEGESPELLNAHYLAPLEPALRAEAFLAQSQNQGREPNPLVAPLGDKPEALIEVAALLLEIGLRGEASRWIDEAVRHRDLPMLRYLAAWSLLQGSRMEAEAAVQIAAAARLPFEPPYPWREIERKALLGLRERFPNEARLAEYAGLVADL